MKPITKTKRFVCVFMAFAITLTSVAVWRIWADDGVYDTYYGGWGWEEEYHSGGLEDEPEDGFYFEGYGAWLDEYHGYDREYLRGYFDGVEYAYAEVEAWDGFTTTTMVVAGESHNLALRSDGTVWAWGMNFSGQLGDGTTTHRSTPVQVSNLNNITSISAGSSHSLALRSDGTVWAWGGNGHGQLGDGTTTHRPTPVQVSNLNNISSISAGMAHSLALRSDGTVWAWGMNQHGSLGDGTTTDRHTPVQVSNLNNISSISAGEEHNLALRSDGTVWAWGRNSSGRLGDGTTTQRHTPVQVSNLNNISSISAGRAHSLALRGDGTVWAWGWNESGQLGDGTTTHRHTPVQVSNLNNISSISTGGSHSLALRSDGTVWAWGGGGLLGDGTTIHHHTPVQVSNLNNISSISAGQGHSLAIRSDGTVWAWGSNWHGQLGDGTTTNRPTPVQVHAPGSLGFFNLNVEAHAPTPTPPPTTPTHTTISLTQTLTTTTNQEQRIIGTLISPTYRCWDVTWEVCTPDAVTVGSYSGFTGGTLSPYRHNLGSFSAVANRIGQFTLTARTPDGAYGQMTLIVNQTFEEVGMQIADLVVAQGQLRYRPIINGNIYRVYRLEGRVVLNGNVLSVAQTGYYTYYLIRHRQTTEGATPQNILVSNTSTLQMAGFLHNTNTQPGGIEAQFDNLTQMRERGQQRNSRIQTVYNRYLFVDTSTSIGLIIFSAAVTVFGVVKAAAATVATGGLFLLPAFFFVGSAALSVANDVLMPDKEYTHELLMSMHESAWQRFHYFDRHLSPAHGTHILTMMENGYLRNYVDAVLIQQAIHAYREHRAFYAPTAKYLSRAIEATLGDAVFQTALYALNLADFKILSNDVLNKTAYLVFSIEGKYVVSLEKSGDPDLVALYNSLQDYFERLYAAITNPQHKSVWANMDFLADGAAAEAVYAALSQTIIINSPVDVAVYDAQGHQIGLIVGNEVKFYTGLIADSPLIMRIEYGAKILHFPHNGNYRIEIIATAYGFMTYMEFRTNADGDIISNTLLAGVTLEPDKTFAVNANGNDTNFRNLYVNNEPYSIIIDVTAGGQNGTVVSSAGGATIRGTAVELYAVPNEGYVFAGWYENGVRVYGERLYVFVALNDRNLEARFITDNLVTPTPPPQTRIPGDVDNSGTVTAADVALLRAYMAGFPVSINRDNADVNGDGEITAADLNLIRAYLAGHPVTLR